MKRVLVTGDGSRLDVNGRVSRGWWKLIESSGLTPCVETYAKALKRLGDCDAAIICPEEDAGQDFLSAARAARPNLPVMLVAPLKEELYAVGGWYPGLFALSDTVQLALHERALLLERSTLGTERLFGSLEQLVRWHHTTSTAEAVFQNPHPEFEDHLSSLLLSPAAFVPGTSHSLAEIGLRLTLSASKEERILAVSHRVELRLGAGGDLFGAALGALYLALDFEAKSGAWQPYDLQVKDAPRKRYPTTRYVR